MGRKYPTMAAGPGSLFSDVPSYRQCEATMGDLTGKVAIVTGASKGTGGKERNESYKTDLTIF